MSDAAANKKTVAQMWQCLYEKDWAGLEAMLAPDCHYEDVPAPDSGATGVAAGLQLAAMSNAISRPGIVRAGASLGMVAYSMSFTKRKPVSA